jgi:phosphohistidine phosphatase
VNIYVLRHGIAVPRGAKGYEKNDDARPLTAEGKKQLRQSIRALKKMELNFDALLASPLPRAAQTAQIVAGLLKLETRLKFSDALMPEGEVKMLLRQLSELKSAPENILLVGHEPYLSGLISLLTAGGKNVALHFKKGGLCKLEIEGRLRDGAGARLAWLLTPKQMKLMA